MKQVRGCAADRAFRVNRTPEIAHSILQSRVGAGYGVYLDLIRVVTSGSENLAFRPCGEDRQ